SNMFNDDVQITLRRPAKSLPEPAPETVERSTGRGRAGGDASGSGSSGSGGLANVRIGSTSSGPPSWGGTKAVFDQFIHPFMKRQGLSAGSQKRDYNTGSNISDHFVGATRSYATDYPTSSGEGAARALAKALG